MEQKKINQERSKSIFDYISAQPFSSFHNLSFPESNLDFDWPFDRRTNEKADSDSHKPRYFSINLGEMDYIRRAVTPRVEMTGSESQNSLLTALYEAQEESSRQVAQRLHDESTQLLAIVYLELGKMRRDFSELIADRIDNIEKLLDNVCNQIRGLSHELHPPILSHLGLGPALQFLAEGITQRSKITTSIVCDVGRLDKTLEIALYRVVQEALSNIVRHADATESEVRLWTELDSVHCTITDNGRGFHVPGESRTTTHGLGLLGIYERVTALGGDCDIISCRRKGTHFTELQVEIPL